MACDFLEHGIAQPVWINRHTMIAVTTMMLVAEAYGLDTAPMEGFDPRALRQEFGLPENAEIVALLAIGYAQTPDKPYGGRMALSEIVHEEYFGRQWKTAGAANSPTVEESIEKIERRVSAPLQPEKIIADQPTIAEAIVPK